MVQTDGEDPAITVQKLVKLGWEIASQAGLKPAGLTAANRPPQSFCRAGTSARSGEGAKELKPILGCTDVFPKAVGRGQHLPYTHVISITLPHEDQQVRGSQPGGMHEQIYDCTPVVMDAVSTTAGTKVQQRLARQNDRGHLVVRPTLPACCLLPAARALAD